MLATILPVVLLIFTPALDAQSDQTPDNDDPLLGSQEGPSLPQNPRVLQEFLPDVAIGYERTSTTTSTNRGVPTAEARYGNGPPGVIIRIVHLWGEPGERYLLDLIRRSEEAGAATSTIGPYTAFFFQERTNVTMALLIEERYLVESEVTGGVASTSSARRALEGVDIERLRNLPFR